MSSFNTNSSQNQIAQYIMTVYHHNEDFKFFIEYYIPQIKFIFN